MRWSFQNTGFNTGSFNMNLDLELVSTLNPDETRLRFYRWNPFCISLGANQPFDSIDLEKANQDGIDVVKRPTGGRAILHSEELTYSVVHPLSNNFSPKILYNEINQALKSGLEIYNPILNKLTLEHNQPNFPSFYKEAKSNLCFAVSAKSEINFNGKKLVGSAQRKIGNVILQHGSILCGSSHRKLIDYLEISSEEKLMLKKEIIETTTELETILDSETDYEKLIFSLKKGFEKYFNFQFEIEKETTPVH